MYTFFFWHPLYVQPNLNWLPYPLLYWNCFCEDQKQPQGHQSTSLLILLNVSAAFNYLEIISPLASYDPSYPWFSSDLRGRSVSVSLATFSFPSPPLMQEYSCMAVRLSTLHLSTLYVPSLPYLISTVLNISNPEGQTDRGVAKSTDLGARLPGF